MPIRGGVATSDSPAIQADTASALRRQRSAPMDVLYLGSGFVHYSTSERKGSSCFE